MNKKLEETKERLNNFKTIKIMYGNTFAMHLEQLEQLQKDIETVLNYMKNSIPKKAAEEKITALENENHNLKEQIQNYIPRRRVRRVFKQLKKILEQDVENENKIYIENLKKFIKDIEKDGQQLAKQDIKQSIEHLLSIIELQ